MFEGDLIGNLALGFGFFLSILVGLQGNEKLGMFSLKLTHVKPKTIGLDFWCSQATQILP